MDQYEKIKRKYLKEPEPRFYDYFWIRRLLKLLKILLLPVSALIWIISGIYYVIFWRRVSLFFFCEDIKDKIKRFGHFLKFFYPETWKPFVRKVQTASFTIWFKTTIYPEYIRDEYWWLRMKALAHAIKIFCTGLIPDTIITDIKKFYFQVRLVIHNTVFSTNKLIKLDYLISYFERYKVAVGNLAFRLKNQDYFKLAFRIFDFLVFTSYSLFVSFYRTIYKVPHLVSKLIDHIYQKRKRGYYNISKAIRRFRRNLEHIYGNYSFIVGLYLFLALVFVALMIIL